MHSDTFTAAARQNFQTDAIFKSNDLHYNGSIRESIKSKGDKPMELMEAIYKRRSVRFFTEEKVDKDVIDTLLNAAAQAQAVRQLRGLLGNRPQQEHEAGRPPCRRVRSG